MVLNCPNLGFCSLVYETLAGVWGHFPQRGNYETVLRLGWQNRTLGRTVSFARILILLSDDWEEGEKLEVRSVHLMPKLSPFHLLLLCTSESPGLSGQEKRLSKTARKQQKADLCPKGPGSGQTTGEEGFGKDIRVEGEALV